MSPSVPSRFLASAAIILAAAGGALGADDGVPRVLLDRELNATQVNLTSIGEGQVRWLDGAGRERARAIDELLAVIDPDGALLPPDVRRQVIESLGFPVVETTDGQRLLARLRDDPEGSDEFVELRLVGGQTMRVSVERIAGLTGARSVFDESRPARQDAPSIDDVVELTNGDRVSGFVERLGSSVWVEVDGVSREIPMSGVASIELANPKRRVEGTRVWLDDGSIIGAGPISGAGDRLVAFDLTLARENTGAPKGSESEMGAAMRLPLSRIAGIVFDAGNSGVRPLAGIGPSSFEPTGQRRWTPPPITGDASKAVLGASTIELPGPMRVRWSLPEGAARLAGVATLGDAPGQWADCAVSILLDEGGGQTELARARLRPGESEMAFNLELPRGIPGEVRTLEVRVDAGAYGPVQDRVLLERVLLLVEHE